MSGVLRARHARESDGAAIGEAHAEAWLAGYGHIFESEFLIAAAESRRVEWPNVVRMLLEPPNLVMVGELDARVVAFAYAHPAKPPGVAEIAGFYCHPDAWGSGIAAELMTRTRSELAQSFGAVFLWTLRDTARSRRFYEKAGFRATGNERNETLTNWTTGAAVECPAVEYAAPLPR